MKKKIQLYVFTLFVFIIALLLVSCETEDGSIGNKNDVDYLIYLNNGGNLNYEDWLAKNEGEAVDNENELEKNEETVQDVEKSEEDNNREENNLKQYKVTFCCRDIVVGEYQTAGNEIIPLPYMGIYQEDNDIIVKKTRVYHAGVGMVYEDDPSDVSRKQSAKRASDSAKSYYEECRIYYEQTLLELEEVYEEYLLVLQEIEELKND